MSTLNDYLVHKRRAVRARDARIARGEAGALQLAARVSAAGGSGVRRIRIREHELLSDSPPEFAGHNLGPTSPELQLGVLGSCVTHIVLIQAADREIPIDALEVEVSGRIDPRGGQPGFEQIPVAPHEIACTVHIESPATTAQIDALFEAVERTCPILNLLRHPQPVRATVRHTRTSRSVAAEHADAA